MTDPAKKAAELTVKIDAAEYITLLNARDALTQAQRERDEALQTIAHYRKVILHSMCTGADLFLYQESLRYSLGIQLEYWKGEAEKRAEGWNAFSRATQRYIETLGSLADALTERDSLRAELDRLKAQQINTKAEQEARDKLRALFGAEPSEAFYSFVHRLGAERDRLKREKKLCFEVLQKAYHALQWCHPFAGGSCDGHVSLDQSIQWKDDAQDAILEVLESALKGEAKQ